MSWVKEDLIGTKDGVNKTFTLSRTPDIGTLRVIFNSRILFPNSGTLEALDYSRSLTTITLGTAPNAGDRVWARYQETAMAGGGGESLIIAGAGPRIQRTSFYYVVELRDKSGNLLEIMADDISRASWSYATVGGCDQAEISLRRDFDNYKDIDLDYDVRIYRETDPRAIPGARLPFLLGSQLGESWAGSRQLRWSGFVREIEPVLDEIESVTLRCSGYARQLEYLMVPAQTYISQDPGVTARSIIDNYAVDGSQVKRTSALGLMEDTGVTINSLVFDTSVFQCLTLLGQIGGNAEWGVLPNREVYFVPRQQTVRQTHLIGKNIKLFSTLKTTDDIVNRVYVRGGNQTTYEINYGAYDTGYQKERIVYVPAISDTDDASLWATAYFARFGDAQKRARLVLSGTDDWIESIQHPLGLLRVLGGPLFLIGNEAQLPAQFDVTTGRFRLADTFGKVTDESYRIAAIRYTPQENSLLRIDIDLGERSSAWADLFRSIEYQLQDLRQGAA